MRPRAGDAGVFVFVVVLASLILMTVMLTQGGTDPSRTPRGGLVTLQGAGSNFSTTTDPATTTTEPAAASSPSVGASGTEAFGHSNSSVAATTTTTTGAPAQATGGTATAAGPCGGQSAVSVGGQQWSCTFDEEFNGNSLDSSKWIAQQTANSNYHSGMECYEDSPNNVSVSSGALHLTAEKEAAPFMCPAIPAYQTSYTSGMVSTYQRFNQTNGLFAVRAKISAATEPGLQTSLWLYPAKLTYGAWPASGEIDIAEMFSQYPTLAIPYVHYNNSFADPDATNDNCVIGDPSQFHTYAVAWTPQSLTFIYDGTTCLVDHWNAAVPQSDPEPFDKPFIICLTQALGIGTNAFEPGTTPLPATTTVDWVRVWGAPA